MSFPTARYPNTPEGDGSPRSFAARTLREADASLRVISATVRDSNALASEGETVQNAKSTLRDYDLPPESPFDFEVPAILLERYEVTENLLRGAEADLWRANLRSDGTPWVLKLYRSGISPDPDVLNRI